MASPISLLTGEFTMVCQEELAKIRQQSCKNIIKVDIYKLYLHSLCISVLMLVICDICTLFSISLIMFMNTYFIFIRISQKLKGVLCVHLYVWSGYYVCSVCILILLTVHMYCIYEYTWTSTTHTITWL